MQLIRALSIAAVLPLAAGQNTHVHPLFDYEVDSLNDEKLSKLLETRGDAVNSNLFRFGNGSPPNPDHLKTGACKVFPGDEAWPSQSVWDDFNELLGKNALIETVPLAAVCYQNLGVYDAAKCATVRERFTNQYTHEDDPTSVFWPLFQGRTCMPTENASSGNCTHGGSPVYAVNVSSVSQIQLAVNFARNANLRLVIKNTGHCYLGKSNGAGALSVWTHNLKDIQFYKQLDIPGYSGPALKVGAGVTVREVYEAADRNGVSALGGICESVGYAGGYVAGGGHTPLSGLYGMATDHVMALEVVTADGRYITASPESNTDLYWALRGGGGSTYGVVTSVIIRVHPAVPVVTSEFIFETSANVSADAFWEAFRTFLGFFPTYTGAGTYSWWSITPNAGAYSFRMMPFFAPNHTIASYEALVKPWFDRMRELGIVFTANTTQHSVYLSAYMSTWGSNVILNGAGRIMVPSNWLLPRRNWESPVKFNATLQAMRTYVDAGRILRGYHQEPGKRAGAGADNAVHPAWRETLSMLILGARVASQTPTTAEVKTSSLEMRDEIIPLFRSVAPESEGGGQYSNEANVDEPGWQEAFYGSNYGRLLEIKRKWDPARVFYATTGVGSEEWEVRDGEQGVQTQNGRLCRA